MILHPIEQRNTAKGQPYAVLHFDRPLSKRQERLLEMLPAFDSRAVVPKTDASMKDLSALTAKTGVEYALFTKGGERLVIRGNARMTNVSQADAKALAAQGYRWSGHTHPGTDVASLLCSDGDIAILRCFHAQKRSAVYNSTGNHYEFGKE